VEIILKNIVFLMVALCTFSLNAHAVDGGAVIGGAIGGATGAAIGYELGDKNGAILGGAIGGATGAAIGSQKKSEPVIAPRQEVRTEREVNVVRQETVVYSKRNERNDREYEDEDEDRHHDNGRHLGRYKNKEKHKHRHDSDD
jgi:uncharacterized protein YcfJ